MLNKESYELNEKIIGKINVGIEIKEGDYSLIITLTRVYDWYDETIRLEGNFKIEENSLLFKINNGLESGLYEILSIKDTSKIKIIVKDLEVHILSGSIINNKDVLINYVLKKYK